MRLRHEKINAVLKREVSEIIHNELQDSGLGFVTVIRVDLTPNLRFARIYFSVFGTEKELKDTQKALGRATPFVRCLIGQRMKLRCVPEISFKLDQSAEHSIRIDNELDKIKEQDEPR
ncbi:MAG: 30S ribosome-binding factor RbfA [Candidatus Omnitrophota bacterium]